MGTVAVCRFFSLQLWNTKPRVVTQAFYQYLYSYCKIQNIQHLIYHMSSVKFYAFQFELCEPLTTVMNHYALNSITLCPQLLCTLPHLCICFESKTLWLSLPCTLTLLIKSVKSKTLWLNCVVPITCIIKRVVHILLINAIGCKH